MTTYTKLRNGDWGLRLRLTGDLLPKPGDTITVTRKDGSTRDLEDLVGISGILDWEDPRWGTVEAILRSARERRSGDV